MKPSTQQPQTPTKSPLETQSQNFRLFLNTLSPSSPSSFFSKSPSTPPPNPPQSPRQQQPVIPPQQPQPQPLAPESTLPPFVPSPSSTSSPSEAVPSQTSSPPSSPPPSASASTSTSTFAPQTSKVLPNYQIRKFLLNVENFPFMNAERVSFWWVRTKPKPTFGF
eukprot:TRINITY_DN3921_c0_g2_i1.p1 TRINITY_DN3921_c0_g2~~TRINITY_DN3921_c0_g2_i1.p1  ORF type:complete len:165 (+),score=49.42 TRINITY_DN3921_c0_g2_i1:252-746(+)